MNNNTDYIGNGANSDICISIRWSPIFRYTALSRIDDELYCPSNLHNILISWFFRGAENHLSHYFKVTFISHIWVGESMNSDIMTSIESGVKLIWMSKDAATDHEMGCYLILRLQKFDKGGGKLIWITVTEANYLGEKKTTNLSGSVIKSASIYSTRRIPNIAHNHAFNGSRTNFRAGGVGAVWVDRDTVTPGDDSRHRNVGNFACCYSGIQSIDPCLRHCACIWRCEGRWKTSGPFCVVK